MSSRLLIAVLSTLLFATACVPQTSPTNLPPPPPPPPMPSSTHPASAPASPSAPGRTSITTLPAADCTPGGSPPTSLPDTDCAAWGNALFACDDDEWDGEQESTPYRIRTPHA